MVLLALSTVLAGHFAFGLASKPHERFRADVSRHETALNFTRQLIEMRPIAYTALWNGTKVLGSDGGYQCEWCHVRNGDFLGGGPAPEMCARSYADAVSDSVKRLGFWQDCPSLASWWKFLPDRSTEGKFGSFQPQSVQPKVLPTGDKLYIDIGANIGSCLMPMAARPDVEAALAFEPSPKNLFYLTSSLLRNPNTNAKVALFPIALGDKDGIQSIFSEHGNAGNTVVGRPVNADPHPVGQVTLERLDEVFKSGSTLPYIHLMKIDAQGFEVKIMQGAENLFASGAVNAVKFELATQWLVQQGTSSAEYMNTYLNHGFQIYDTDSKSLLSQEALYAACCGASIIEDFVAVRMNKGEVATQKPIYCEQAHGGFHLMT